MHPMGVHRVLCPHCAKSRLFWTCSPPMAKVTAITAAFPYIGLLTFLLSLKTHIKLCFTVKMPDCCLNLLFLPCGRMLP